MDKEILQDSGSPNHVEILTIGTLGISDLLANLHSNEDYDKMIGSHDNESVDIIREEDDKLDEDSIGCTKLDKSLSVRLMSTNDNCILQKLLQEELQRILCFKLEVNQLKREERDDKLITKENKLKDSILRKKKGGRKQCHSKDRKFNLLYNERVPNGAYGPKGFLHSFLHDMPPTSPSSNCCLLQCISKKILHHMSPTPTPTCAKLPIFLLKNVLMKLSGISTPMDKVGVPQNIIPQDHVPRSMVQKVQITLNYNMHFNKP